MPKLMRARGSVYAARLPALPSAQDGSLIFGRERRNELQLTKKWYGDVLLVIKPQPMA